MAADSKCYLCLTECESHLTAVEDDELRKRIDRIFYFQVVHSDEIPGVVCNECRTSVNGFYEYAEQVKKNQLLLLASLGSGSTTEKRQSIRGRRHANIKYDDSLPEAVEVINSVVVEYGPTIKTEPDETEWVAVDNFFEVSTKPTAGASSEIAQEAGMGSDDPKAMITNIKKDNTDDDEWIPSDTDDLIEKLDASDEDDEIQKEEDETFSSQSESHASAEEEGYTAHEDVKKRKRKHNTAKNKLSGAKKSKSASHTPQKTSSGNSRINKVDEQILQHYKLSCDLCSTPLEDFTDLRKHFKYVHNEPAYLRCCNKKLTKKCWMVEHIQLHLNPDAFHCDICNKSYSSSKVLKEHTKEVHSPNEGRAFKCETCQKPFVSFAHLNAHIMVAHGSHPCPQCPKVLASQGSLKKHLVAMHGEGEQHVCDVCARVFRSKQCFDTHVKGHMGTRLESKVQCSICSCWLTDKYCLTKHIRRMHVTPETELACELCGKVVRNQDALYCHMRRTHAESRFECDICHKKFKRPHHMREHVAIHHTGEDLYGCNYCSERFNTKNKQYMHRKTVHPAEWEEEMRKRVMKVP